jgi:hypothetical protein
VKKLDAFKEATVDTVLGTVIMVPLNYVVIAFCLSLNFNALQITLWSSSILFTFAVVRKAIVRIYFQKKLDSKK